MSASSATKFARVNAMAGGGGTPIFELWVGAAMNVMVLKKSSLVWDRVYKSERFGLEQGIIYQLYEEFGLE